MRAYEIVSESRLDDIEIDDLRRLLPNFSQAIAATPIWRGMDHPDDPFTVKFARPSNVERVAANTNNHSNMVVSNSPRWANYPPRNKAFICTSDRKYAKGYGSVYRILPKNDTVLGIAPKVDFWQSFTSLLELGTSFINLNEAINNIGWYDGRSGFDDSNYQTFRKQFNELPDEGFYSNESTKKLLKYAYDNNLSPADALEKLLDPTDNGFKIKNIREHDTHLNEVWFANDCLVVHPDFMDELKNI